MFRAIHVLAAMSLVFSFVQTKTLDEDLPEPILANMLLAQGADQIDWADAVVKDGIRYVLGLSEPPSNYLPIIVQNVSGETIENLRLRVVWTEDDSRMVDSGAWVYPQTLNPGEYGFAGATNDTVSARFPLDHGKLSIYVVTKHDDVLDGRVPLNITSASMSSTNRLTGNLINANPQDAEDIWLHWVCIERSGFVIKFDFDVVNDIRVIRSGSNDEFTSNLTSDCSDGFIVAAEGRARAG